MVGFFYVQEILIRKNSEGEIIVSHRLVIQGMGLVIRAKQYEIPPQVMLVIHKILSQKINKIK